MPVLPDTFVQQAPGGNVRDALGAYSAVSSLMERKQRLNMAQEQQDMERAKFEAYKPAIVAKAQADFTSAAASIANAARMEELRKRAAASSVDYNDRFLNIMSIPDDKDRSDTLGAFMGEVSWMDNPALPEYQGFARAVKDERAKSFTMAATNLKLDDHLNELQTQLDAKKEQAAQNAKTAIEVAQIRSNAPSAAQKLIDAYQEARNSGADEETISALKGAIERTTTRAAQASVVERAIANRDAALAAGDRAKAQVFQDEINKATSFASDPIKNPLPAATTKAAPASTTPFKEIKLPSGGVIKIREK